MRAAAARGGRQAAGRSQKKQSRAPEQKYYQNFDFYFKRTSFRQMTLYFKTQYKPFYEQW